MATWVFSTKYDIGRPDLLGSGIKKEVKESGSKHKGWLHSDDEQIQGRRYVSLPYGNFISNSHISVNTELPLPENHIKGTPRFTPERLHDKKLQY